MPAMAPQVSIRATGGAANMADTQNRFQLDAQSPAGPGVGGAATAAGAQAAQQQLQQQHAPPAQPAQPGAAPAPPAAAPQNPGWMPGGNGSLLYQPGEGPVTSQVPQFSGEKMLIPQAQQMGLGKTARRKLRRMQKAAIDPLRLMQLRQLSKRKRKAQDKPQAEVSRGETKSPNPLKFDYFDKVNGFDGTRGGSLLGVLGKQKQAEHCNPSGAGEGGFSVAERPYELQGSEAWPKWEKATGQLKKAGLNPFAAGFAAWGLARGYSPTQVKLAAERLLGAFPELSEELTQLTKESGIPWKGLWQGAKGTFGKAKGLFGRAAGPAAAEAGAAGAAGAAKGPGTALSTWVRQPGPWDQAAKVVGETTNAAGGAARGGGLANAAKSFWGGAKGVGTGAAMGGSAGYVADQVNQSMGNEPHPEWAGYGAAIGGGSKLRGVRNLPGLRQLDAATRPAQSAGFLGKAKNFGLRTGAGGLLAADIGAPLGNAAMKGQVERVSAEFEPEMDRFLGSVGVEAPRVDETGQPLSPMDRVFWVMQNGDQLPALTEDAAMGMVFNSPKVKGLLDKMSPLTGQQYINEQGQVDIEGALQGMDGLLDKAHEMQGGGGFLDEIAGFWGKLPTWGKLLLGAAVLTPLLGMLAGQGGMGMGAGLLMGGLGAASPLIQPYLDDFMGTGGGAGGLIGGQPYGVPGGMQGPPEAPGGSPYGVPGGLQGPPQAPGGPVAGSSVYDDLYGLSPDAGDMAMA